MTADAALFRGMLAEQGLAPLADERVAAALAVHAAMGPALAALRSVPLSYLEPVVEPTSALAWLERGGGPVEAVGGVAP